MDAPTIISIITAAGLLIKVFLDNRNTTLGTNSSYLDSLVKNIEGLTKQNTSLQAQSNEKQEQINVLKKQVDALSKEMEEIKAGRYRITVDITTGKRPAVDEVNITEYVPE